MKILITGGSGFIGSHLVRHFAPIAEVTATASDGEHDLACEVISWDEAHNRHFDVVLHQRGDNDTLSFDEETMNRVNVQEPLNLFSMLHYRGCRKFVYASSCAVYGNQPAPFSEQMKVHPLNVYGLSKVYFEWLMDDFGQRHDVQMIGLRYSNVYGTGEGHKDRRASMVHQLTHQMMNGDRPQIFANGEQARDFVHVLDVVQANARALESNASGVFNVGSGEATSFNDLVEIINQNLNTNLTPKYICNPSISGYQDRTLTDLTLIREVLGYEPEFNIRSGVKQFISELQTNPSVIQSN